MDTAKVFRNSRNDLRSGWRILLYILLSAAGGLVLLWCYAEVRRLAGAAGGPGASIMEYILLDAALLLAALIMLNLIDRRPFACIGLPLCRRACVEAGQGVLLGTLMVSVIFFVEWGGGWVGISWSAGNSVAVFRPLGRYVVLFTFAAAFEEIAVRGYAFQALIQGLGKIVAVCATSFIFGLLHLANPNASTFGVINTMLAGVWLSLAYLKTRSLWLPISLHGAWNFSLGFVWGFPVSGVVLPGTMTKVSEHGPSWLTGAAYGPEAGAVTTIVLILGATYVWRARSIRPAQGALALWYSQEPRTEDER